MARAHKDFPALTCLGLRVRVGVMAAPGRSLAGWSRASAQPGSQGVRPEVLVSAWKCFAVALQRVCCQLVATLVSRVQGR